VLGIATNEARGDGVITSVAVDTGSNNIESREWPQNQDGTHEIVWASGCRVFRLTQNDKAPVAGPDPMKSQTMSVLIPLSRKPDYYLYTIILPL
jgi:hypothetical protein